MQWVHFCDEFQWASKQLELTLLSNRTLTVNNIRKRTEGSNRFSLLFDCDFFTVFPCLNFIMFLTLLYFCNLIMFLTLLNFCNLIMFLTLLNFCNLIMFSTLPYFCNLILFLTLLNFCNLIMFLTLLNFCNLIMFFTLLNFWLKTYLLTYFCNLISFPPCPTAAISSCSHLAQLLQSHHVFHLALLLQSHHVSHLAQLLQSHHVSHLAQFLQSLIFSTLPYFCNLIMFITLLNFCNLYVTLAPIAMGQKWQYMSCLPRHWRGKSDISGAIMTCATFAPSLSCPFCPGPVSTLSIMSWLSGIVAQ